MECQVIYLLIVIDIVDFNLEPFLLLEVVVNNYLSHKLRIESIVDYFCLTNFIPNVTLRFEKYKKGIRKTESVHIW